MISSVSLLVAGSMALLYIGEKIGELKLGNGITFFSIPKDMCIFYNSMTRFIPIIFAEVQMLLPV